MGKIVWLASYPKSGNTWLRILLTNYWRNANKPVDINALDPTPIASSRVLFEEFAGVESSELTASEIDQVRSEVYRQFANSDDIRRFMKVHDTYRNPCTGGKLFPKDVTACAIYLVRNPLDVAVSFSEHRGSNLDKIIAQMAEPRFAFNNRYGLADQLRQILSSWSNHVRGWQDAQSDFPLLVIRYEDMCRRTEEVFAQIIKFIDGTVDCERIQNAVKFSDFRALQRQEQEHGFAEHPGHSPRFFRRGQVGSWRTMFSEAQVQQVLSAHGPTMKKMGYLNSSGEIII